MIIRELDYERSTSVPTKPLARRFALVRIDPYALITLSVAVRFVICLVAIWMWIQISLHAPNDGIAVLAALACAGVIYGLLGKRLV